MPVPRVVEANGLKLRLWDHGRPGHVVLFVHGYLDTGRSFDAVAHELHDMRCLALDLRGHGQSDRVGGGGSYHLLDHMKDLAIVLDALAKKGEAVEALVAHSMGGNIAFLLAGAQPALVKRLLLVDTCGPPPEDPEETPGRLEELVKSVLAEKRAFSSVSSMHDAVEKIRVQNPGLSVLGAERMVKHAMVDDGTGRLAFPFDPKLRGPSPVRWPEAMWLAMSKRMTMPVRVLRAADGYVPEGETTEGRLRAMKRSAMKTIPGGHHLHVEAPDAVALAVRDILGERTEP
jgi:pimeloyl-ACP methyl ester carboxylesterase